MSKAKNFLVVFCFVMLVCLTVCLAAIPMAALAEGEDIVYVSTNWHQETFDDQLHSFDLQLVGVPDANSFDGTNGTMFSSFQMTVDLPDFVVVTSVDCLNRDDLDTEPTFTVNIERNSFTVAYSSDVDTYYMLLGVGYRFVSEPAAGRYACSIGNVRFVNTSFETLKWVQQDLTAFEIASGRPARGDFDADGDVDIADVMLIQQYIVDSAYSDEIILTDDQWYAADVNGDKVIDVLDCQYIRSYIIGKIDSLDNISSQPQGPEMPDIFGTYNDVDSANVLTLTSPCYYTLDIPEGGTINGTIVAGEQVAYLVDLDIEKAAYHYYLVELDTDKKTYKQIREADLNDGDTIEYSGTYDTDVSMIKGNIYVTEHGAFYIALSDGAGTTAYLMGTIDFHEDGTCTFYGFGKSKEEAIFTLTAYYDADEMIIRSQPIKEPVDESFGTYTDVADSTTVLTLSAPCNFSYLIGGEYTIEGTYVPGNGEDLVYLVDLTSELNAYSYYLVQLNVKDRTFKTIKADGLNDGDTIQYAGTYTADTEYIEGTVVVTEHGAFSIALSMGTDATAYLIGTIQFNDDGTCALYCFGKNEDEAILTTECCYTYDAATQTGTITDKSEEPEDPDAITIAKDFPNWAEESVVGKLMENGFSATYRVFENDTVLHTYTYGVQGSTHYYSFIRSYGTEEEGYYYFPEGEDFYYEYYTSDGEWHYVAIAYGDDYANRDALVADVIASLDDELKLDAYVSPCLDTNMRLRDDKQKVAGRDVITYVWNVDGAEYSIALDQETGATLYYGYVYKGTARKILCTEFRSPCVFSIPEDAVLDEEPTLFGNYTYYNPEVGEMEGMVLTLEEPNSFTMALAFSDHTENYEGTFTEMYGVYYLVCDTSNGLYFAVTLDMASRHFDMLRYDAIEETRRSNDYQNELRVGDYTFITEDGTYTMSISEHGYFWYAVEKIDATYTYLGSVDFAQDGTCIVRYFGTGLFDEEEKPYIISAFYDAENAIICVGTTVYFTNNMNWADVYAHVWYSANGQDTPYKLWCHETMTYVGNNDRGQAVFAYTFPIRYTYIIFTNGSEETWGEALSEACNAYYLAYQSDNKWVVGQWYCNPDELFVEPEGTVYKYENDQNIYVTLMEDDRFAFTIGSDVESGTYFVDEDGNYYLVSESRYTYYRIPGFDEENKTFPYAEVIPVDETDDVCLIQPGEYTFNLAGDNYRMTLDKTGAYRLYFTYEEDGKTITNYYIGRVGEVDTEAGTCVLFDFGTGMDDCTNIHEVTYDERKMTFAEIMDNTIFFELPAYWDSVSVALYRYVNGKQLSYGPAEEMRIAGYDEDDNKVYRYKAPDIYTHVAFTNGNDWTKIVAMADYEGNAFRLGSYDDEEHLWTVEGWTCNPSLLYDEPSEPETPVSDKCVDRDGNELRLSADSREYFIYNAEGNWVENGFYMRDGDIVYLMYGYTSTVVSISDTSWSVVRSYQFDEGSTGGTTYSVVGSTDRIDILDNGAFFREVYDEDKNVVEYYNGTVVLDAEAGTGTAYLCSYPSEDANQISFWYNADLRLISYTEPATYTVDVTFYVDGELNGRGTNTSLAWDTYGSFCAYISESYRNYSVIAAPLSNDYTVKSRGEDVDMWAFVDSNKPLAFYFTTAEVTYEYEGYFANPIETGLDVDDVLNYMEGKNLYVTRYTKADGVVTNTEYVEVTIDADNVAGIRADDLARAGKLDFVYLYDGVEVNGYLTLVEVNDLIYSVDSIKDVSIVAGSSIDDLKAAVANVEAYVLVTGTYVVGEETVDFSRSYSVRLSADGVPAAEYPLNMVGGFNVEYDDGTIGFTLTVYVTAKEPEVVAGAVYSYMDGEAEVAYWVEFEDNGKVHFYEMNGALEPLFSVDYVIRSRGEETIYDIAGDNYGLMTIVAEGYICDGEVLDKLVFFEVPDDDVVDTYTLTFGPNEFRFAVDGQGFANFYQYANGELTVRFTTTYVVDGNTFIWEGNEYEMHSGNTLSLELPAEEGLLFVAANSLYNNDIFTVRAYDNGKVYYLRDGIAYLTYAYDYYNGDEDIIILLDGSNKLYYYWQVDDQWHTTAWVSDSSKTYRIDGSDNTLTVYYDKGKVCYVMGSDDERAVCAWVEEDYILVCYSDALIGEKTYVYYILANEDTVARAQWYDIEDREGQLFLSGERTEPGYAALKGVNVFYGMKFLYTYSVGDMYVLSYGDVEMMHLQWNAEVGTFSVELCEDLRYPVNVVYTLDGEEYEAEVDGYLFMSYSDGLISETFFVEGSTDHYVITGVYADADHRVKADDIFTDTTGAATVYVSVDRYTVADVMQAANALEENAYLNYRATLSGTVTEIKYVDNKKISFTFAIDGLEGSTIHCYNTVAVQGGELVTDIAVGDTVTVTGAIMNYRGTIEFVEGSTVYATATMRTIYFTDNWNWGEGNGMIYCYAFKAGTATQNAAFPGELMTYVENNSTSQAIYSYAVSSHYDSVIFVKNDQSMQTVDITLGEHNAYYLTDWDNGKVAVGTWDK